MTVDQIPEGFRENATRGRFAEKIGPLYFRRDGEQYRYGFLADESHTNFNGIVHGGMMMSFMDEMLGQTIWHAVGRKRTATISLNFDFVSAAKAGEWLELQCDITRQGVSVVFIRGELICGDRVVMTADGIWKIIGR